MKFSSNWESGYIASLSLRWVESCISQWPAECTNHKYCCWATVWQRRVILWSEGSLVMYFTSGSISVGRVLDHAPRAAYPTISIKYMSSLKGKTGTNFLYSWENSSCWSIDKFSFAIFSVIYELYFIQHLYSMLDKPYSWSRSIYPRLIYQVFLFCYVPQHPDCFSDSRYQFLYFSELSGSTVQMYHRVSVSLSA